MIPRTPRWRPAGARMHHGMFPPVGSLIALHRKVFRVVEIKPRPPVDWDSDDWDVYNDLADRRYRVGPQPAPEEWDARPHVIVLQPFVAGQPMGKPRHRMLRPYRYLHAWDVLPEHYPVCVDCGDPYPCLNVDAEKQAAREAAQVGVLMDRMPGCCWGCGKTMTVRVRKLITFDGDNVDLPGGISPVTFWLHHHDCRFEAQAYEKRWVAADPTRRWRLQCPGNLVMHADGRECTLGDLCPGDVSHRSFTDHRYSLRDGSDFGCARCRDAVARGEQIDGEVTL